MAADEAEDTPNIEEVLASIRRILADSSQNIPTIQIAPSKLPELDYDFGGEFELPALFRNSSRAGARSAVTVRANERIVVGGPSPAARDVTNVPADAEAASADAETILREMTACKDTVIARMGQTQTRSADQRLVIKELQPQSDNALHSGVVDCDPTLLKQAIAEDLWPLMRGWLDENMKRVMDDALNELRTKREP